MKELSIQDYNLAKIAKSLVSVKKVPGGVLREVGCALITKKGRVFTGASLDLACGLGFCAESSAISNMISHSNETEIKTIVAFGGKILPPCGRCRELMNVINKNNWKNADVIISKKQKVKLKGLLPKNWLQSEGLI